MSSTTPAGTPSKEPRGFGWGSVGKAVRRATLLGSARDSRPSTPTPDSGAASAAASTTNLALSNPNIASSASASTANLAESTTTNPKAAKKDGGATDDSDRASLKSKKSERSLTDRLLLRRSSTSSVKGSSKKGKQSTLDLGRTSLDTSGAKPVNPVVAGHMVPSPIAESPNREAMETPPLFGFASSPLASENVVAAVQQESPSSDSPPEPVEGVETESNPTSPQYTHPPLLDSSAGNPGAFVDDSDTLPQPTIAVDPYAVGPYGRAASRVSLAAAAREEREERVEDLPNPHEHEGSLPNPHEGASTAPAPAGVVGATRGLEAESSVGGPSLGGISSEADYGVQIDRAARDGDDEGSVGAYGGVYADSPSSHGGQSFSAPGGVEDRKPEGEGYGYGTNTNTATAKATEAREREPEQEREPTLPAYQLEAVGNGNGHDVWRNDREDPFVTSQYPSQAQTYSQNQPYTIPRPPSPLPPTPPGEEEYVPSPSQEDQHASWGSVQPPVSSHEPAPVPHISVTKSVGGGDRGLAMPQPQRPTTQVMPIETHRDDHPTILMPLPPFNDVVAAQPLVRPPEPYSTRAPLAGHDNDERRPLLGGSATKPLTAPYGIRPAESTDTGNPSPASAWAPTASSSTKAAGIYSLPRRYGSTTSFRNYDGRGQSTGRGGVVGTIPGLGAGEGYGQNAPKLHELGWFEYHLPDGSFYYVHPTLRVTTDVNLRNEKVLDDVTQWIDEHPPFGNVGGHPGYGATTDGSMIGTGTGRPQAQAGNGVEVWLRDPQSFEGGSGGVTGGKSSRRRKRDADEVKYVRCWVDHQARTVVLEKPSGTGLDKKGKGRLSRRGKDIKADDDDEDQLDMEYRYWSFMEAHPAHTVLPVQSRNEALEVLTWAYTDRLLPAQKPVPPPFGPSECDELRNLIKSFPADSPDDNGIQTRVISRVLLRVASWRQAHFRPNKPLPKDVKAVPPTSSGIAGSAVGRSVLRLVWDMFVVLVCLGLPYIFVERKRRDEEAWRGDDTRAGGGGTSVFAIGVISCLVSAIILSASVTFLSLPGMTGAARVAGFVAISCAVGSMLASTIAFIRFRNEFPAAVGRASGTVSGEGLVGISNKAIVNSLPLVFVAYSIIGFVVGLSIYSFRGSDLEGTAPSTPGSPDLGTWFFSQGAKWSALGLLGAAGGVVAMSWVVWKQ